MAATICPICKKTKLGLFNSWVALDGDYCKSCLKEAEKKGITQEDASRLTLNELKYYLKEIPAEDSDKWLNLIFAQRRRVQKDEGQTLPVLANFHKAYSEFFESKKVQENSSLQSVATQTFWHLCKLKKMRLDARSIEMQSKVSHRDVKHRVNYMENKRFDGRYESKLAQETVTGTLDFIRDGKKVCSTEHFNLASYRVMSAYNSGKDEVICPSCGMPSSRENLLDGCDYCGSVFSVEDFTGKVADFSYYQNKDIEADTDLEDYKDASLIVSIAKSMQSISQEVAAYENELKRHSAEVLNQVRAYDPGFSAEELYSTVGNMLMAHYYANDIKQITAFWENPDEEFLKSFIDDSKDVIDVRIASIQMTGFSVNDTFQTIWIQADVEILRDQKKFIETVDTVSHTLKLVRAAGLKSQTLCETKLYRCKGCGMPLSLMEGCHCEYCGEGLRLSDYSWAILGIDLPQDDEQNSANVVPESIAPEPQPEFNGKYCEMCGRKIGENEPFCRNCGSISTYHYVEEEETHTEETKIPTDNKSVFFSKKYELSEGEKVLCTKEMMCRTDKYGSFWQFQLTSKALVFTFTSVLFENRDEGFTKSPDVIPLTDIKVENGVPAIKQKGDHVIISTVNNGEQYLYLNFAKEAKQCAKLIEEACAAIGK